MTQKYVIKKDNNNDISYLPCVNVNPTKGKWSPVKAVFACGGTASDNLISVSSTSKLDVSVGLDTWNI